MTRVASTPRKGTCRVVSHSLPVTLALGPPAVRMLIVVCWTEPARDGGLDTDHEFYPVLAIVGRKQHMYSRYAEPAGFPPVGPTHRTMEEHGWHHVDEGAGLVEYDVVYLDPDFGLTEGRDIVRSSNCAYEVVLAPWDPTRDDAELAPVVERVSVRALEKARRVEAQKGAAPR